MNPEKLLIVLAVNWPDWEIPWTDYEIPWAGIGTFLLGAGGALSGVAALITARNRGRDEATVSTTVSRSDDDGGSGISSSRSVEPRTPKRSENSND
jgi:hypothetical protein